MGWPAANTDSMRAAVASAASPTAAPSALAKMPVAMAPGEIEFTRMPASDSSMATERVSCSTAAFEAE